MQVVADEPVYDAPCEQKRQLEAMRQRTDLSDVDREAYLQRLRIIWRSQLRWGAEEEKAQKLLQLTEVLQRFTLTSPVAILLGVPGSGKTTFLRWLALHMARACLSSGRYSLPHGLGRPQVPILIQTNDYAERLDKEYITLKQFLIAQWNRIHPGLAMKLLDELAQGHCLILFDGLDEGATAIVRRRVLDAINGFISDYSSEDPNIYNRFIITSRIADREREAFSRYMHYTLLELDEQRIDQILANWCHALARYWTISARGLQSLTEPEEAEARAVGTKQQVQVLRILKSNPNLMHLAINPMTLTMIVILQASGGKLLFQRMELYQMITRALLDTRNQESGRKVLTDEELPLAEQLLSNLAYYLQGSDGMLTAYDVAMTTRQTLATFYQRQLSEVRESDITRFIEMLRRSSGLIVEGGEDLFYFANRPFQDYFVVLYLLRMPQEELNQLVVQHYHTDRWHEPLQLMLTYKSRQALLRGLSRRHDRPAPRRWSPMQPPIQLKPEDQARNLLALLKEQRLTKQCVEELLTACTDTRLLSVNKQPEPGIAPSPATLIKHPKQVILVSALIAALLLSGILWAHALQMPVAHTEQRLVVNPSLLDFGHVEVGSKSVLSLIIKKSSEFRLKWQIVPASTQWLQITLRPKANLSSNLREDIYNVTANTSKLKAGKYSAHLNISSETGSTQQVTVKIQVISPSPPPAKLSINPLLLDFGSLYVGNQDTQLLKVSNSGGQELRWTVDKGNTSWLTLDQDSGKIAAGTIPQSINVKVDTTNLKAGQYSATIKFTSNGGNASASVTLIVVFKSTPAKVPTVTSISPTSGSATGGTSVTITGTGFTGIKGVSFGETAATSFTVNSSTQITAVSPQAASGPVDVTVTTPGGTSATDPADVFTYTPPTVPIVTKVSPNSGSADGGTSVIIAGSGFTDATMVSFGPVAVAASGFTVNSDTQITTVSLGTTNSTDYSSTVDVTVTTPIGTSATSSADVFTYIPLPFVLNINPGEGPIVGGTSATITGFNFTAATSVSFGSTAATSFTVDSDTQITAVSPAVSSDGIVDVIVTTPGGTSATSAADQFTYYSTPPIK